MAKESLKKRGHRIFELETALSKDGIANKSVGGVKMIFEVDGLKIEMDIRVDSTLKAIKYELTSENPINPLDAAICLWQIIQNSCNEIGIPIEAFIRQYYHEQKNQDLNIH